MINLTDFVETIQEINSITEEIVPLDRKLKEKNKQLNKLNEDLSKSLSAKYFLAEKIYEDFTEKEKEDLKRHREYIKANSEGPSVYYDSYLDKIFDPFFDEWYICDYIKNTSNNDEIKFSISCKKNEGTISGMMTILDLHYTSWIKISELKLFD